MATRSNIRVILKEEDRNKDMKFNPELIGKDSMGLYKINDKEWGSDQIEVENGSWETVNPNGKPALSIYHHWDGYPEGVGVTLIKQYNTYEKALNLMLGGDCSTINDSYTPYALRKGEDWDTIEPQKIDEGKGIGEEWDYMFKDGEWYVRDGYDPVDWTLLTETLKKREENE